MARKRAMKWNFCVTIAILNANNQVTNNRHARAITRELLVCRLCIITSHPLSVGQMQTYN